MIETRDLEIERGIAALNIVYQKSNMPNENKPVRFYIMNEGNNVVVWDKQENKKTYDFGTCAQYAKLMTVYAELPCEFNLKDSQELS